MAGLFAAAVVCLCGTFSTPAGGTVGTGRTNLGPEDDAVGLSVTVWLKLHNEAALDARLQQMYDKNSPDYHHWLTPEQYRVAIRSYSPGRCHGAEFSGQP